MTQYVFGCCFVIDWLAGYEMKTLLLQHPVKLCGRLNLIWLSLMSLYTRLTQLSQVNLVGAIVAFVIMMTWWVIGQHIIWFCMLTIITAQNTRVCLSFCTVSFRLFLNELFINPQSVAKLRWHSFPGCSTISKIQTKSSVLFVSFHTLYTAGRRKDNGWQAEWKCSRFLSKQGDANTLQSIQSCVCQWHNRFHSIQGDGFVVVEEL